MSSKRKASQVLSIFSGSPNKKSKEIDTCFRRTLRESGLTVLPPPEKCHITQEVVHIVRNLKKNLEKVMDYPRNAAELVSNFEKECQDHEVFKHYLYPNIVGYADLDSNEYQVNDSVIKILLSVPVLQNKLIDYIFEKAIDLAAQSQCGPWIKMILKCFSTLDSIVDSEKISTNIINLLDITTEKMVKLEIITAIPDIIGDQEHNNISTELSRILGEDHELIPAILECLSYLCLSDEQYELLQKKTLTILMGLTKCHYFPNFVKFLLIPGRMSDSAYLEAVQGLRNALGWPTTVSKPQEIASSQVLTATSIRNSMISSKVTGNAWLKVVSNCKLNNDHKPIDIVIMLILFSTAEEKQKQVENLIRKQIKLVILKEDLLNDAFDKFKPILQAYIKYLIELTNSLLKTKSDPMVESFAAHMYTLMLSKLDDCSQTIVAELLQLGLDSKQCVMNILSILNKVAEKDMSLLKPQSLQMLTLLDRMDDMPLTEVRLVMNLLCGLSYSYENSVIRDDLHMIIRKELSGSNLKIKVQGIVAGIHAVKYLMASRTDDDETREMPDDISYGSNTHLPEGDLREAAQIIELISRSTKQFPDMIAFFYDELSKIISAATYINKNFLSWLADAVTNDLQQNFIVDSLAREQIGDIKLFMQYCLNSDSEIDEVIAINIAGLALEPQSDVSVTILSPLFQLVQTLHSKQLDGDLSSIDALLGCAIVMPKFDVDLVEDMEKNTIGNILDCLVLCVNWFRELVNAFASQQDDVLLGKLMRRVIQLEELESLICDIIVKTNIAYKPPVSTYDVNKYTGEQQLMKVAKVQTNKPKSNQKKNIGEDTVLPETARSQATQNLNSIKSKLEMVHNIKFRNLNMTLLNLLNLELVNENHSGTELTVKTLNFVLRCLNNNLDGILISRIKKITFLSKEEPVAYDPKIAEECAKTVSEILPKFMSHMDFITSFLDTHISKNTQDDSGFIYTVEMLEYLSCLENMYTMLTIYLKWMGFRHQKQALLKSSLRSVANSDSAIISLKDLLIAVAEKFEKHENYCLQFSTASSLIELVQVIQSYSENKHILKILKNLAQNFMTQLWKTPDGAPEKGLHYNQCIDRLAAIYVMNNEILALKNLTTELTNDIKFLKTRNDTLKTMKSINKATFPILYRNLGTALYEAAKTCVNKGMTNSEHLNLWKDVAIILRNMSEIAKTLENRNNLSAFFKKSLPVLKLFLTHGMPILELQFKNETQEILELLKILQQSTRFLQSLCCHSRLKKDAVLMSKVPLMRQLLETLIYKVKAALAANKCSEAFWMGNLKNKNIHGEIISTQQSIESEESLDDGEDELPEDADSGDSDCDVLNPDSKSISDIV